MITIAKDQLDALETIVKILIMILGLMPLLGGLLGWYIRKIDKGGRRRVQELRDSQDDLRDIIENKQIQIDALEANQVEFLEERRANLEKINHQSKRILELEQELEKLKREMELLKHADDARTNLMIKNFTSLVMNLGYSDDFLKMCIDYLEGRVELEIIKVEIENERLAGRGNRG